jgi:hypothetical protein
VRDKESNRDTVIPFRANYAEKRILKIVVKKLKQSRSQVIRTALLDLAEKLGVEQWLILAAAGPRVSQDGTANV